MTAGLALGIVSLGITVSRDLLHYYSDWKGYKDDVRQAYETIDALSKTFAFLDQSLQTGPKTEISLHTVECVGACEDGIQRLKQKLKKIQRESPQDFQNKLKAMQLRTIYPFRKSTLQKLKEIVQDLIPRLSLAIQATTLDNGNVTRTAVAAVEVAVGGIEHLTKAINASSIDIHHMVAAAAADVKVILSTQEARKLENILTWLSAPDSSTNHAAARAKHEPGTGQWFLKSTEYHEWLLGSSPRLWLYGKAGCCKTVLCSTIIEDMRHRLLGQQGTVLVYFYFTFSDVRKQSYSSLLQSVITELSRDRPIHPSLSTAYDKYKPHAANLNILEDITRDLFKRVGLTYLIIDGLDECPEEQREEVMQGLKRIFLLEKSRLLITSRNESDIADCMTAWCERNYYINEECVNADIDTYIKNALATDKRLACLSVTTKEEIQDVFHQKSEGMFRWAALQLQELRNLRIRKAQYISNKLNDMPRTLDETYNRISCAIDESYSDEVRTALEWIAFSQRPLSVAELAAACSIQIGRQNEVSLEEGDPNVLTGIIDAISSLITTRCNSGGSLPPILVESDDDEPRVIKSRYIGKRYPRKFDAVCYTKEVRFAHFLVKEYLMSSRLRQSSSKASRFALSKAEVHHHLGQRCCAYLLYVCKRSEVQGWIDEERMPHPGNMDEHFQNEGNGEKPADEIFPEKYLVNFTSPYPLLPYATQQWFKHVKYAEENRGEEIGSTRFQDTILEDDRVRISWLRFVDPKGGDYVNKRALWWGQGQERLLGYEGVWHDDTKVLYWASLLGLRQTVSLLTSSPGADVNHVGGRFGTAIQAASYHGHEDIVGILLSSGAQVKIEGGEFGSAVHAAADLGHRNVMAKLLLSEPNAVNINRKGRGTPLYVAACGGHADIVSDLLCAGAAVDITGGWYHSPLQGASHYGHVRVVKILLEYGADPSIEGGEAFNAIIAAARSGHEEIVKMLIEAGANLNILAPPFHFYSSEMRTPLDIAVCCRNEAMVKMLLEAGADVNLPSQCGKETLLCKAIRERHRHIIEILIDNHANINYDEHEALIHVVRMGWENIVRQLLNMGVNIHGFDRFHENALMAATRLGHTNIVEILLFAGAKLNDQDGSGRQKDYPTALTQALLYGSEGWQDDAADRSIDIVQKLIGAGAEFYDGIDHALHQIIRDYRYLESRPHRILPLARYLIDKGADINAIIEGPSGSPREHSVLFHAVRTHDTGLVELLLEHGANIDGYQEGPHMGHESILYAAIANLNLRMVTLLLEKGSSVENLDAASAYRLFNVATFQDESEDTNILDTIITVILDRMLEVGEPNDGIFDDTIRTELFEAQGDQMRVSLPRLNSLIVQRRRCHLQGKN
ncbi:hypothetical protein N0V90_006951 [Kalmusia sp. IMI 367209]|nr:hypothetical protein N0V90_006951 [Kalmusia sp. IMI 367209]